MTRRIKDHRVLIRKLEAWWRRYETWKGVRRPKTPLTRSYIVRFTREADRDGVSLADVIKRKLRSLGVSP